MPRAHAKFSPSKAEWALGCPGSTQLIESLNLPEEPSNIYAEVGTAAHAVAAKVLKSRDWFDHDYYETPDQEQHVPMYVNYINDWSMRHPSIQWQFEQSVNPAPFVKTNHCRGTSDAIGIVPDKLIVVVDYKHGEHVVQEAEDNMQLILYALGAMAKLRKQGHDIVGLKVVLAIVQPRAHHPDGPIREWTTHYRELMRWARWFRKQARLAMSDDPPFHPAPDTTCRWCPAQGACRALAEYELRVARDVFTAVEAEPTYKDVNTLTRKEISHLLKEFPGMRRWMSNVSEYALSMLEQGARIPYFGLKDKYGYRQWAISTDELEKHFEREVLYEEKLRSPAQVEKLLGKHSVDDYTERPKTGHIIVETNDASDASEAIPFDEVE